jgi:predicted enzyme related to lactoylglutathione lyase
MANPVVHFEIMGTDAAKLQSFYSGLFDWEIDAYNPMNYGVVKAGEGGIGGGVGSTPMGNKIVTVYVQVPDPQAALDKAVELGASVVMPVTEIPNMVTFGLFADPEGNVVGIVKG